jgi:hypothetical protein
MAHTFAPSSKRAGYELTEVVPDDPTVARMQNAREKTPHGHDIQQARTWQFFRDRRPES